MFPTPFLHFDSEWQKDVASLVSKDYNHPSVVMYCVGNEITDTGLPFGGAICKGICAAFKALDDSRPTLIAINSMLSTLANMKAKQAACGSFDLTGFPESAAYYAAILWGAYHKPYIGVRPLTHSGEEYTLGNWRFSDSIPCWTWNGYVGKIAQVEVFSEGAEVELFVNGVSVGKKTLEKARADFELSYTPGVLTAVSYNSDGAEFARTELASADRVTKLCVEPEDSIIKADGKDLAFIAVGLRDSRGVLKMTSTADITVSLEGPAKLLAFGSADPCAEPEYYSGHFGTYNGRILAVIQSTGESGIIRITASADGMDSADAEIESK
jgi:beta-galactosidase